jgi:hypothetical protein
MIGVEGEIILSPDINTIQTNIIINGFSIKEVILHILQKHPTNIDSEKIADEITDVFETKVRIIQGC